MKTQKQMKEELKEIINNHKCFDYMVEFLPERKETIIRISHTKEIRY